MKVADAGDLYQAHVGDSLARSFSVLATSCDGVAKLRKLILSLGMRGQLVKQQSTDESAEKLLIRVSQKQMPRKTEAGMMLHDTIVSDEWPCERPQGWTFIRLGSALEMINGRAFKASDWKTAGIPIIRIQNLNRSGASFNYCDEKELDERHVVRDGDLLISWSGTPGTSFGAFIWARGKGALNQHIFRCIQRRPIFLPEFLRLAVNDRLDVLISQAHGGVGLQHVTKGKLENLVLVLPPLSEQARIVTRVEELMKLCDALEKNGQLEAEQHARLVSTLFDTLAASESPQALTENWQRIAQHFDLLLDRPEAVDALEQTILQLAIRGVLVLQNPRDEPAKALMNRVQAERTKLGAKRDALVSKFAAAEIDDGVTFEAPPGWMWSRLGLVIELISGQHLTPNEYTDALGFGIPYLTGPAEFGMEFPEPMRSTNEKRAVARRGDILITVKGAGVGKLNVTNHDEIAISRQLMAVRPVLVVAPFIQMVMEALKSRFQERAVGIAIPGIGREDVLNAPLCMPPLAEQHRIVARVKELRELSAQLRERLKSKSNTQSRLAEAIVSAATI